MNACQCGPEVRPAIGVVHPDRDDRVIPYCPRFVLNIVSVVGVNGANVPRLRFHKRYEWARAARGDHESICERSVPSGYAFRMLIAMANFPAAAIRLTFS